MAGTVQPIVSVAVVRQGTIDAVGERIAVVARRNFFVVPVGIVDVDGKGRRRLVGVVSRSARRFHGAVGSQDEADGMWLLASVPQIEGVPLSHCLMDRATDAAVSGTTWRERTIKYNPRQWTSPTTLNFFQGTLTRFLHIRTQ